MNENTNDIAGLQWLLAQRAEPDTKVWRERCLKRSSPFRGVKMAGIRASLHARPEKEGIDRWRYSMA